MGTDGHQAAEILRKEHPEVFDYADQEKKLDQEIAEYEMQHLGFNHRRVRMIDTYMLAEHIALNMISEFMREYQPKEEKLIIKVIKKVYERLFGDNKLPETKDDN